MAQRRCLHTLSRRTIALLTSNSTALDQSLITPPPLSNSHPLKSLIFSNSSPIFTGTASARYFLSPHCHPCHFSSNSGDESDYDEEGEETDGEETDTDSKREYSEKEKEEEAASVGYKVIGPLQETDQVFKRYKPVFAVVQIGSHQFKVSNGDCIFTEKLKFCEVNDKLILNKVLLLGSSTQTIVGRPTVPNAVVHVVVEEHALDAKVIIFKKKRRKNYRRKNGHRQELTKLTITYIQGIEKPKPKVEWKHKRAAVKKEETVAVTA